MLTNIWTKTSNLCPSYPGNAARYTQCGYVSSESQASFEPIWETSAMDTSNMESKTGRQRQGKQNMESKTGKQNMGTKTWSNVGNKKRHKNTRSIDVACRKLQWRQKLWISDLGKVKPAARGATLYWSFAKNKAHNLGLSTGICDLAWQALDFL